MSALFLVCRIIKVSFRLSETRQLWEYNIRAILKIRIQWSASRVQHPESSVQHPKSSVQSPESSVQNPASRVQGPESSVQSSGSRTQRPEPSVQSPASRVQRPESSVQLLRPESRNSGMPVKAPFCKSYSKTLFAALLYYYLLQKL